MTVAQLAYRRPPGPDQTVLLGIDQETLEATPTFSRQNGRRMMTVKEPELELGINLRSATDIYLQPEER